MYIHDIPVHVRLIIRVYMYRVVSSQCSSSRVTVNMLMLAFYVLLNDESSSSMFYKHTYHGTYLSLAIPSASFHRVETSTTRRVTTNRRTPRSLQRKKNHSMLSLGTCVEGFR